MPGNRIMGRAIFENIFSRSAAVLSGCRILEISAGGRSVIRHRRMIVLCSCRIFMSSSIFELTLAPRISMSDRNGQTVDHFVPSTPGRCSLLCCWLSIHEHLLTCGPCLRVSGFRMAGGVIFWRLFGKQVRKVYISFIFMLASGPSRRTAFLAAIWLCVAPLAGMSANGLLRFVAGGYDCRFPRESLFTGGRLYGP